MAKTTVLRLSITEDFVILSGDILTQYERVTDGWTVRQTDKHLDDSYYSACI